MCGRCVVHVGVWFMCGPCRCVVHVWSMWVTRACQWRCLCQCQYESLIRCQDSTETACELSAARRTLSLSFQFHRRNDRDAIRRRLATGVDGEYCYCVCDESSERHAQRRRRRPCSSSSSSLSGFSVDLEVCLVGESPSTSDDRVTWPASASRALSDADSQTVIKQLT